MPALRFDDKVAVITGAGRGLGRLHARLLAERGCRVLVNDPGVSTNGARAEETPAEEVVKEILAAGGEAVADHHSVIDHGADIVTHALDAFGGIDVLVNNAGIAGGDRFERIPPEQFDLVFDTHFQGTVAVTRAAWTHLAASGHGRVVNTSSSATFGGVGTSHYIAAKAAIFGLTRALAPEGARVGINVNSILPIAYTRLTAQIPEDGFREFLAVHFPPEGVTPFVVYLCHESTTITGEAFSVGSGRAARVFLAEAPGFATTDGTPDAFVGHDTELLATAEYRVPINMTDEVRVSAEFLGGEVLADYRRLAKPRWT